MSRALVLRRIAAEVQVRVAKAREARALQALRELDRAPASRSAWGAAHRAASDAGRAFEM
jgi:hypothetical protein